MKIDFNYHDIFIKINPVKIKDVKLDRKQLFQVTQDLDTNVKLHIGDANVPFLREKLRFLLKILPAGKSRKSARGILTYFSRWTKIKTWRKIIDLLKYLSETILGKTMLKSKPFLITGRVVGTIDIEKFYRQKSHANKVKSELK